jgi:hypothetical protein
MIPAGGALVSVMNAIGDAPPELGIRHIGCRQRGNACGRRSRRRSQGGAVGRASIRGLECPFCFNRNGHFGGQWPIVRTAVVMRGLLAAIDPLLTFARQADMSASGGGPDIGGDAGHAALTMHQRTTEGWVVCSKAVAISSNL